MSLLQIAYSWIVFFTHFANLCLLIGEFNLFTFSKLHLK